jgi:undecaprenyl-diphosphatase
LEINLQFFDDTLYAVLNRGAANPLFDRIMPWITNLHQKGWFIALVLLGFAYQAWTGDRRRRVWILSIILALSISDLTAARVVKKLSNRPRPCSKVAQGYSFPDDRLVPGTGCPGSTSFPSNHASNMMALASVCWWFSPRKPKSDNHEEKRGAKFLPLLWFLIPLVIGYSRIYLGYHYPTDVIGGYALGALCATIVIQLVAKRFLKDPVPEVMASSQKAAD